MKWSCAQLHSNLMTTPSHGTELIMNYDRHLKNSMESIQDKDTNLSNSVYNNNNSLSKTSDKDIYCI